eukprot:scaffold64135_cov66-Phaeocystis_antarctica.AAC.3
MARCECSGLRGMLTWPRGFFSESHTAQRPYYLPFRTLVPLGVAAIFYAALAPFSALLLLQLAEVDHSEAVLTGGASEAARLDQYSIGGGGVYDCADCEVDANYTTPEAHAVGPFRSTIAWQVRAAPRLNPPPASSSTNRHMHKRYLRPTRLWQAVWNLRSIADAPLNQRAVESPGWNWPCMLLVVAYALVLGVANKGALPPTRSAPILRRHSILRSVQSGTPAPTWPRSNQQRAGRPNGSPEQPPPLLPPAAAHKAHRRAERSLHWPFQLALVLFTAVETEARYGYGYAYGTSPSPQPSPPRSLPPLSPPPPSPPPSPPPPS